MQYRRLTVLFALRRPAIFIIIIFFMLSVVLPEYSWSRHLQDVDPFEGRQGCFLIVHLKDGRIVEQIDAERCQERLSPCSTFKIPVAAMTFDQGIIDEKEIFRWDGKDYGREACNRDQNIRSWIVDSVVWVTQRLTEKMGMDKVKGYLKKFSYGNCDMSGGIDDAWLTSTLKISASEQVAFLRRLWLNELPISKSAQAGTRELINVEIQGDDRLDGKTGSGFVGPGRQLGWFVGHVRHSGQDYIFALNITDRYEGQTSGYAGQNARRLVRKRLEKLGLFRKSTNAH